ncbi:MAG: curlin [Alphaproteobacteria bacterium]|nr:curlin [Alphaproteobacteria bacterium]
MTRTTLKTTLAALTIATVAALTATPSMAGGSISVSLTPQDAEQEKAMRAGLTIFGIVNGIKNGGHIGQNGNGNTAGLGQNGSGNLGIVHQEGDGHNGTVQQNGNNNAHGLFQFGENTDGHVAQNGNGETGATFQFGW